MRALGSDQHPLVEEGLMPSESHNQYAMVDLGSFWGGGVWAEWLEGCWFAL